MIELVRKACVGVALILGCVPLATHAQRSWKPDKNIEIVVGAGPGAAADATGRMIQRILTEKKLVQTSVTVSNRPGAGYAVAWNYVNNHNGDAHYLAPTALSLVTNAIMGMNSLTHGDVTPIAQLFTDYVVHAVRSDSPIKDGKDLIDRLRRDPASLSIALAAARGNQNHLATGLAMRVAGGVDVKSLKIVIFDSSALSMAALLGGHVDVVAATALNVLPHIKSGRIRVIAISSPERLRNELAGIPTWKEQGVNAVFDNWRGVIGPRGLSAAQIAFWEETFANLVATDEWKKDLEKNYLTHSFMKSQESRKFLQEESVKIQAVLTDLGLAKLP